MLTGREYFYPLFRESVEEIARESVVLDLGTTSKFRKELAPFRSCFGGNYFSLDYKPSLAFGSDNVDLNASIYALPLGDGSVGAVLCISVFEHLYDPFQAANELLRILKPGGKALFTIPFIYGEHAKGGDYGDFYRFTEEGIRYVFRNFTGIEVVPLGGSVYCRLTMFPKLLRMCQNGLCMKVLAYLDSKTRGKTVSFWLTKLVK